MDGFYWNANFYLNDKRSNKKVKDDQDRDKVSVRM